jgi:Fur family transcriptional regulator, peroxide stress response regulator
MSSRFEEAVGKLKMSGVRMTPQRHAILSYMLDTITHPTADDIYRALEDRFPSMSVATVYNNLRVFIEAGLVRELTYGDSSSRYDADMSEHYHAICDICGKIADFEYPALHEAEKEAREQTGILVRGHRMEVHGLCSACSTGHSQEHEASTYH